MTVEAHGIGFVATGVTDQRPPGDDPKRATVDEERLRYPRGYLPTRNRSTAGPSTRVNAP
jgi:hypothetical protein